MTSGKSFLLAGNEILTEQEKSKHIVVVSARVVFNEILCWITGFIRFISSYRFRVFARSRVLSTEDTLGTRARGKMEDESKANIMLER